MDRTEPAAWLVVVIVALVVIIGLGVAQCGASMCTDGGGTPVRNMIGLPTGECAR